ncbi:MAG: glycine cleavage system protein R [Pseudomonadales bacterium]
MSTTYVLSFSAQDKPGLVELLSNTIDQHGGNWLESAMSHLAERFVGIIVVDVAGDSVDALRQGLTALSSEGLEVTFTKRESTDDAEYQTMDIELVGHDRPGIIRDISKVLANFKVNVEDMTTELMSGSMSAEPMFKADLHLHVKASTDVDELQDAIEQISGNLMVDIHVD